MKAFVTHLRDNGSREKFLVEDWPAPPATGPGQIRTRTLYTGLTNGSERNDLTAGNYSTPDDKLPATWGYQNVAEVVEIGDGVTKFSVGDRLYLSIDHVEEGLVNEDFLMVRLPDEVDSVDAALFGMASVAMRTCRNVDIRLGEKVLVVGAGFLGQLVTQIGSLMGGEITLVDVVDKRLEKAKEIGAVTKTVNTAGDGWEKNIADGSFDVIIDVAGVPGMEDQMIKALKHRGRLLFIAGRFKVEYDFNLGQGREITIKQNSHFDNDDLARLCSLVAEGKIKIAPLIQEVIPASDCKRIYDTLRDNPMELGGTVFDWQNL
jgi:2-desacetyl-2-hydroxyethyl bacteriochlorophyllide A dehydrogenase